MYDDQSWLLIQPFLSVDDTEFASAFFLAILNNIAINMMTHWSSCTGTFLSIG